MDIFNLFFYMNLPIRRGFSSSHFLLTKCFDKLFENDFYPNALIPLFVGFPKVLFKIIDEKNSNMLFWTSIKIIQI